MGTCRLSKLAVLETWKNEILAIEVKGRRPDNMPRQDQLSEQVLGRQWITSREGQKMKDDLAAFLDELKFKGHPNLMGKVHRTQSFNTVAKQPPELFAEVRRIMAA